MPDHISYEIIVIDDHSSDNTSEIVESFMMQNPEVSIRLNRCSMRKGLSCNFTDAAFLGRGEYFCRFSGHFQDRRDAILPLVQELGKADIIIGFLERDGRGFFRRNLSRLFTFIVNVASGHRIRYYVGVVLFRRAMVLRWHSYRHQGYQADMITRMLDEGHSYIQVPITAHLRPAGKSRAITVKNLLSVSFLLADILGRRLLRGRAPAAKS